MTADGHAYRAIPNDARRGGIVLAIAGPEPLAGERAFGDGLAAAGYEVLAAGPEQLEAAAHGLDAPVFLLSFGAEAGRAAWAAAAAAVGAPFAAISLYDPPLDKLVELEPPCPAVLHASGYQPAWPAWLEALAERRADVRLFPYAAKPGFGLGDSDPARLARLRTLQSFHRASGAKGEGESG